MKLPPVPTGQAPTLALPKVSLRLVRTLRFITAGSIHRLEATSCTPKCTFWYNRCYFSGPSSRFSIDVSRRVTKLSRLTFGEAMALRSDTGGCTCFLLCLPRSDTGGCTCFLLCPSNDCVSVILEYSSIGQVAALYSKQSGRIEMANQGSAITNTKLSRLTFGRLSVHKP